MSMVRTRFAPSPTGYLHIGGARTALYCWLYARKMQGTFILRIEDTDLERSTDESVHAIFEAMSWLGLNYDEGPYYQTKHMKRYQEVIERLMQEGKAYRCYCKKERLEQLRTEQIAAKQKPRYDGHCRDQLRADTTEPYVIRFKNPLTGCVEFNDLIRGPLRFDNQELDDLIIARSDGSPTYNFTVVVDDWDMHITHVIRGDDHINNTPRQINILQALGAKLPLYAHVPMILGRDGKRLSKRHGAVGVMHYREQGFLPQALLNYLVRLGWSHGDQEIFSMEELIRYFEISDINKAPAAYDPDKLLWLNQHYMKTLDPQHIVPELAWHMLQLGIDVSQGPDLIQLIAAQAPRTKTLGEMAECSRYFYEDIHYSEEMRAHFTPALEVAFTLLLKELTALSSWNAEAIHALVKSVAEQSDLKLGKLAQPLRIAITGGTISPSIDITLFLLGKDKSLARIAKALQLIIDKQEPSP
jgi:glutamyl-tRNA synthetase